MRQDYIVMWYSKGGSHTIASIVSAETGLTAVEVVVAKGFFECDKSRGFLVGRVVAAETAIGGLMRRVDYIPAVTTPESFDWRPRSKSDSSKSDSSW